MLLEAYYLFELSTARLFFASLANSLIKILKRKKKKKGQLSSIVTLIIFFQAQQLWRLVPGEKFSYLPAILI